MLPTINGEFGVVAEPELKFSGNGNAWLKVRGIAKDRVRDAGTGAWSDGDPLFIDIICNQGAENLFESIAKGDTIIVSGKLKQRTYEKDGEKRTVFEIRADSVGVSVRWGIARTVASIQASTNTVANAEEILGATVITEQVEAPF